MEPRERPSRAAETPSMESKARNMVRKKRSSSDSASRESPSTAAKPPPPRKQAHGQRRRRVQEEDDGDADEWVEIDEGHEEVKEAEAYDLDDDLSEPSLGSGDNENDTEVEVNGKERVKKGGKRKKAGVDGTKVKVKRTRLKRAECWQYFKEVKAVSKKRPGAVVTKAKCYCAKLFAYTPRGQTTSLNRRKDVCSVYLNKKGRQQHQGTINFDPEKPGASLIVNHEYDHAEVVKFIAKMIIVHEYPFRMVEHAWFNILMRYMNASYKFIGRKKIRAECMKVYLSEKEILKKQPKNVESISLTCDLWTSNQTLSYLAVVAHYIDDDWVMQCRVLNFLELDPPHSGSVIAQAVFECCQEWKIEDKIMTITMDNASSNDNAAKRLMDKIIARKFAKFIPKYFHVRCCAHIVNLIVNDGIALLQNFINKLRIPSSI
ncbi:zinc finger BED domain-containing protein RICESLEEPER 2-like [Hordeum vulgare]|nr:zinc finger BED domain-containing protein RICESLEEPER 2-like [Hordeum vulgare]